MATPRTDAAKEYQRLYVQIVARPAEESRAAAQKQRDLYASKLGKLGITSGAFTRQYQEALLGIDTQLRYGDELKDSQEEKDRQARRRFYARALLQAREWAQRLDEDIASDGPALLAVKDIFAGVGQVIEVVAEGPKQVVTAVGTAIGNAADAAGGVLKQAGQAASSAVTVLAVGAGVALALYAVTSAKGRRRYA